MLVQLLLFLFSFILLYYGADFALEEGEKIGKYFKMSPLVIGLLIVGFGTSLPEFFVSQIAAYEGSSEIALGNIIGSNISNIFLIMGVATLFVPLELDGQDMSQQFGFHIGITLILLAVLSFTEFSWPSGLVLITFFLIYLWSTFRNMRKKQAQDEETFEEVELSFKTPMKLLLGFVSLYYGGNILVSSGTFLGQEFGVSEYVISAIFVAFGTSFPELVTALVACYRKKDIDLITGNIIGSNIFNVALVLGSVGVYKFKLTQTFWVEMGILLGVSVIFIILNRFHGKIYRKTGVLFLLTYVGVIFYWLS